MEEAVLIADHKPLVKILGAETDYLADTLQKWTLQQTSYHYDIMAKISEKQPKVVLFLLTIRDEKLASKNPFHIFLSPPSPPGEVGPCTFK